MEKKQRKSFDEYTKEFEQLAFYKLSAYLNNKFVYARYFHMFDTKATNWIESQMRKGFTVKCKQLEKGLKNKLGKCVC